MYEKLLEYSKKNIYPFHMPGHKRNKDYFMDIHPLELDITEIPEMDNLHNPQGIIKETQEYLANIFGSDQSFILVNGSSSGIIAAVMTACKEGDYILAGRNSHKSFYSALVYSGAIPIFINPTITEQGLLGVIRPEDVETALENNSRISAVYITSPTYEGFVSDISRISQIVHKHKKLLIIDEAHGAHFVFSHKFPKSSISCGADIVIQSLHKTLPVLTQSSILHINNNIGLRTLLKDNLRFIQTTSPSYLMMSSVDFSIKKISENNSLFKEYLELLENFRDKCLKLKNFDLINKNQKVFGIDISKLVFLIKNMTPQEFEKRLFKDYNIQIEMSGVNHAVLITSVADTKSGFDRLFSALTELDKGTEKIDIIYSNSNDIPEMAVSPRQALHMKTRKIEFSKSLGCISAETITPYPPGIPVILKGELITGQVIETVNFYKARNLPVVGIEDTQIGYINILEV